LTSDITIEGHAFAIERDSLAPPFDLIDHDAPLVMNEVALRNGGVRSTRTLTMSNGTISNAQDCAIDAYWAPAKLTGCVVNDSYRGLCGGLSSADLTDTLVTGNTIGMDVFSDSITRLTNSTVTNNLSDGIKGSNHAYVFLTDSTVSGNGGGGILLGPHSEIRSTDSTVSENAGDGIASSLARFYLTRSTVSENGGDGVRMYGESTGVLSNSTISGNSGAGVVVGSHYPGYNILIRRSTIWDNSGAGIELNHWTSELTLRGTIVGANAGGDCDLVAGADLFDQGANFGDDGSCGAGFAAISGVDPVLADNGGLTRTHALLAGSTAIDAGAFCDYDIDQRALPRGDDACDAGAYEFQCPIVVVEIAGETRILFSPDSGGFDLVTGMLSRLHSEEGFSAASCLGSFSASPAVDTLSDPPPGDGRYYLARGHSDCVGAGFGYSSLDPDPRDLLDAGPCP
jgi:parallel beta-helix repeat protein